MHSIYYLRFITIIGCSSNTIYNSNSNDEKDIMKIVSILLITSKCINRQYQKMR